LIQISLEDRDKPVQPDAALAAVVGKDPLPRTELTKKPSVCVWCEINLKAEIKCGCEQGDKWGE
jgi:hypothetical protein